MNNQKGFALIVIFLLVVALFAGGIFIWQRSEGAEDDVAGENVTTEKEEIPVVVKQSGGAAMLIAECADQSYVAEIADYIIEGIVDKVESKWNEEKTSIFTYADLSIENYLKGIPFATAKLQIITPGGIVGEISQWVEEQPIFSQGKAVRIYLQETNGVFSIVCGGSGISEAKDGIWEPGVGEIK